MGIIFGSRGMNALGKERVAVVEAGADIGAAVERAVELVGGLGLEGGEHAVVKPNVCNAKNPYGMVITDFRIVEAVIRLLREKAGRITVVESDNISDTADNRARKSGLLDLLDGLGVEFLNLSGDDHEVHEVAGKKLRLPRTVLDADCFVNLPKIKTEGHVSITLSIKNLFGVPQRRKKSGLHGRLGEILPYLAKVIRSDLIVVDGIVAMEGNGPLIGTPRELGVVVAGNNPVSVDAVCSRMMGFEPSEIGYMEAAHAMGLGEIELEGIEVVGDGLERFACEFERPYSLRASLKSLRSIRKVYLP
jgi:uncharacterized protein (DUF362 family)